jgi:hypothetical protein
VRYRGKYRGHINERRFLAIAASSLQEVECSDGVYLEIVEGDRRSQIVGGLGGGVNYNIWSHLFDGLIDRVAVAYVHLMVIEMRNVLFESPPVPARVSLYAEENRALIVVYSMDFESSLREI